VRRAGSALAGASPPPGLVRFTIRLPAVSSVFPEAWLPWPTAQAPPPGRASWGTSMKARHRPWLHQGRCRANEFRQSRPQRVRPGVASARSRVGVSLPWRAGHGHPGRPGSREWGGGTEGGDRQVLPHPPQLSSTGSCSPAGSHSSTTHCCRPPARGGRGGRATRRRPSATRAGAGEPVVAVGDPAMPDRFDGEPITVEAARWIRNGFI
jgi:hypothetical protein